MTREQLRETFDEVADLYERARPQYPAEVFDDLAALAGLAPGSRVLEIGCGTGQGTIPLAERGLDVVCVELGESLAAVARRKLARFPNVRVATANFESWEPVRAGFDAITAFTAFHWLDPQLRYAKAARLLRPGGSLAVVATQHVLPEGGESFWVDVQEIYDALAPDPDNAPPPRPDDVPDLRAEIAASGRFGETVVRRYVWDVVYSADEYVAVLDTYSGHRSMPAEARRQLYAEIRRMIEMTPERRVRKTYLAMLNVARRA